MRILFYGDSITDMGRERNTADDDFRKGLGLGYGYVNFAAAELLQKDPDRYEFINRGISGNRIVDLYARIKADCWNHAPDFISILIGVNDIWHEIEYQNGALESRNIDTIKSRLFLARQQLQQLLTRDGKRRTTCEKN